MTLTGTNGISDEILRPRRTASGWTSPRGINTKAVPWRLWEKSKKLFWDPADIDYTADAEQWAAMGDEQRLAVYNVANGFMVGEEAVTLDIIPLTLAMSDEGRLEEVIFLTSFALEGQPLRVPRRPARHAGRHPPHPSRRIPPHHLRHVPVPAGAGGQPPPHRLRP